VTATRVAAGRIRRAHSVASAAIGDSVSTGRPVLCSESAAEEGASAGRPARLTGRGVEPLAEECLRELMDGHRQASLEHLPEYPALDRIGPPVALDRGS
jgi:hypothetical protein